jgi:hypothetical protein
MKNLGKYMPGNKNARNVNNEQDSTPSVDSRRKTQGGIYAKAAKIFHVQVRAK